MRKLETKRDALDFVKSLSPAEAQELCRLLEFWDQSCEIVILCAGGGRARLAPSKQRRDKPWPLASEEILAMRL